MRCTFISSTPPMYYHAEPTVYIAYTILNTVLFISYYISTIKGAGSCHGITVLVGTAAVLGECRQRRRGTTRRRAEGARAGARRGGRPQPGCARLHGRLPGLRRLRCTVYRHMHMGLGDSRTPRPRTRRGIAMGIAIGNRRGYSRSCVNIIFSK